MEHIQLSGSEVMGLMDSSYRLAPNADSLRTLLPDRLRHSFFQYVHTITCPREKVKCFRYKNEMFFVGNYCAMWQILFF